jgi:hypothetical protein
VGCCECGDEPSGSGTTELVGAYLCISYDFQNKHQLLPHIALTD